MSKEEQVRKMTDKMAKFIAHTAKKLPDDVIAKLEELRDKEDSRLRKRFTIRCLKIRKKQLS